eukprot:TRINITY_DN60708_c0_g1_i1.p1 TRINITY_DN60708_c0_g1~~TRINITY_DN60708_c0_g1_i1.p1  ORF type:complete len:491 (+),score=121.77 TRINITY_DN60708_c0_g1_i1:157-1473(+)
MAVSTMIARKLHLDAALDLPPEPPAVAAPDWVPTSVPGAAVKVRPVALPGDDCGASPRHRRFEELLSSPGDIDLGASRDSGLRAAAWRGVPPQFRADAWRLLVGVAPAEGTKERRERELRRKRSEFRDHVRRYHPPTAPPGGDAEPFPPGLSEEEGRMHRQITKDLVRMGQGLWACTRARQSLHRVLWVWALRHPASGYAQGMHDLAAPFLHVFLDEQCPKPTAAQPVGVDRGPVQPVRGWDERLEGLSDEGERAAEADSYWCFSAILQPVQDLFTFGQPGVQQMLRRLSDLCRVVDPELHATVRQHAEDLELHTEGQQWGQWFAYRWMNCLLLREFPEARSELAFRLYDTYLAEGDAFPQLHVHVALAMLLHYRDHICGCSATDALMFMQRLQTQKLVMADLEGWISAGYMYQQMFEGAEGHLREPVTGVAKPLARE